MGSHALLRRRGISSHPVTNIRVARWTEVNRNPQEQSGYLPALSSLISWALSGHTLRIPQDLRRGWQETHSVKPTWIDAERSRLSWAHHWEHSGQAHLERHTFWPAIQETNISVQPSEMEKKISSTILPKCPKCKPQRQWKPLATREIWADGTVYTCHELMVRMELIHQRFPSATEGLQVTP